MSENPSIDPIPAGSPAPEPAIAPQAEASPATEIAAVGDRSLHCPHCGYDLRAATRDQCPECGNVVDRATLAISEFPWTLRKEIGGFRAYWRTMILVSKCSGKLKGEARKPQAWPAARRFWWISAVLIIGVAVGLMILNRIIESEGLTLGSLDMLVYWSGTNAQRQWLLTLGLPWNLVINLPGVLECLVVLFLGLLIELPRLILRPASKSIEDRQTAAAISCYILSPLVLGALLALAVPMLLGLSQLLKPAAITFTLLAMLDCCFILALIISYFVNLVLWNHRLNGRALLAVFTPINYLLGFALGAVLIGYLIPWCVGMILMFAPRLW